MKINLFLLLTFSLIIFVNQSYSQMEIKPAIGINFTGFSQDPENATSSAQLGWQLGGTVSFGDKLYGEGGIFWTYKANDISEMDTNITLSTSLSGIRIPIIVGYHLIGNESSLVGLRAFGGASITIISNVDAEDLSKDDFTSPRNTPYVGEVKSSLDKSSTSTFEIIVIETPPNARRPIKDDSFPIKW